MGTPQVLTLFNRGDLQNNFHTYSAEYERYYVKFYIDGQLMYTVSRYKDEDDKEISGCYSKPKLYNMNLLFPKDNHPLATIANNSVIDYEPPSAAQSPDTFEIDYIKVYAKDCPWATHNKMVNEDEVITTLSHNYNGIKVADGKSLTFINCNITMMLNSSIILGKGSKLILNNSTIASCNPANKWKGVTTDKGSIVELSNYSNIQQASIGVSLGESPMNGVDPSSVVNNPIITVDGTSGIKNCDVGIYLGAGKTFSIIRPNSSFDYNRIGILAESSTGMILDRVKFTGNSFGINLVDSYLHVRDGNSFIGGDIGVLVEGTYPGAAGINIGNTNPDYNNIFSDMIDSGVESYGAEHPIGARIFNCRFTNTGWAGSILDGANQSTFENNTITGSPFGFGSYASGENFNTAQCNVFNNLNGFDIHYVYDNSNSQFLGNSASGALSSNCMVMDAKIAKNIGSTANPAGNCFSSTEDIVTQNSKPFSYHFYNNGTTTVCQEPTNPGNYTKNPSKSFPENCANGIGIFKLIDPDGDGTKGFVASTTGFTPYAGHISKAQITTNIATWIQNVVSAGGDDARTLVNETTDSLSTAIFTKEATLDQWIRYAILRAIDEGDFTFAENTLRPLNKIKWQYQLLGIKLMQTKYSEARILLNSFASRNTNEAYFKEVQTINIKRLDPATNNVPVTTKELSRLAIIAGSHVPASGYAKSLYHLLTGDLIRTSIPSMPAMRSSGNGENIDVSEHENYTISGQNIFYPNPVNNILHISTPDIMTKLELMNIQGNSILIKVTELMDTELNLEQLLPGIYIMKITDPNGKINTFKVNKI